MNIWRTLSATKLYWGLVLLFAIGVLFSPETSSGKNIFLSYGNLTDVLRQVSIIGLAAVGMTTVILIAGIDLSVGSLMAFASVVTGMLLTQQGWTPAATMGVPALAIVAFMIFAGVARFIFTNLAREGDAVGHHETVTLDPLRKLWIPLAAGTIAAILAVLYAVSQVGTKFGVIGVLLVVPALGLLLGALNGVIIVRGRLQPFIVTLAMMVAALGIARLTAGQNSAVLPVYPGSNATADFNNLRSMLWGVMPVPGLFFIAAAILYAALLRFTAFGRYVYAIGGNEEATRLSGVKVDRVKISVYAFSGMLASIAGVLYVAQYRQGKPDAGAGLELDAIAAVVIGGTSLMGGRGSIAGTIVGVLIFGLLSNILQLHNINSNLQLVLKGLIIVVTVLVQERNLDGLFGHWRPRVPDRKADAGSAAVQPGNKKSS
ncbi:ABC transporter permease [Taklimakanibacter deserti]|uniref:ABC transporter permease n=1 Tax=Taklimakanibacter deserti TaxID=2267839 RepID=UPI000E6495D1